jgi:hypothetical protein
MLRGGPKADRGRIGGGRLGDNLTGKSTLYTNTKLIQGSIFRVTIVLSVLKRRVYTAMLRVPFPLSHPDTVLLQQ